MLADCPAVFLMSAGSVRKALGQFSLDWLSASERSRLAAIHLPRRRDEFLAARHAMRLALAAVYPASQWQDWHISSHPDQRPVIERATPGISVWPQLSLSHSGGLIAVAVCNQAVGVDIELPGRVRPLAELMQLIGSEHEQQNFQALPAALQSQAFYRTWTLKEAYYKRQGTGLDWSSIRELNTQSVTGTQEFPGNSAIWEGRFNALPYTLAVCTATLRSPPPMIALLAADPPAFAGLWVCTPRP